MANHAWLESTLRRLALGGLEVLERAARRGVDWAHADPSLPTPTTDHEDGHNPLERTHRSANLDEAFETIGAFMAQTTQQCMNFQRLTHYSEYSEAERTHGSRFHTHRPPTWRQYGQFVEGLLFDHGDGHYRPFRNLPIIDHHYSQVGAAWMMDTFQDGSVPSADFHIEVSPGSYTITAALPHTQQLSQRVSLQAGDSVTLNFDLSPSPDQLVHV